MNKGRGPGRGPAFAKPKEKTSVVLLKLWRYLARYQWIIVGASVISVLGNVLGLLSPRLSGAAIDAAPRMRWKPSSPPSPAMAACP